MQMTYWVSAAIARRAGSLLLVREVAESGEIGWSLPGGVSQVDAARPDHRHLHLRPGRRRRS